MKRLEGGNSGDGDGGGGDSGRYIIDGGVGVVNDHGDDMVMLVVILVMVKILVVVV